MKSASRWIACSAACLLFCSSGRAEGTPSARIDDDTTFADWVTAEPTATDANVFEINVGRTFAPERIREVRVWVDTAGLHRFDDACDDGDTVACTDSISFEELRTHQLFDRQTKHPNTTAVEIADAGEVFVFRQSDEENDFNRMKFAVIDGKFRIRVAPSSAGEYSLTRVHLTVHFIPARRR